VRRVRLANPGPKANLGLTPCGPYQQNAIPTGLFANGNKPPKTVRSVRARWVEAEGLRLKQMGMSYEAIATHITAVGRGLKPPVIALLDGVTFPTNYKISKPSVYLAVKAALAAAPRHEAEEVSPVANRSL
jgi:hypothetical protein